MKLGQTIYVKCYSGHAYADCPESFTWEGTEYEIERVEREWREPGEKHFLVRTRGSGVFELCYCDKEDEWSIREIKGEVRR